MGDVAVSEDSIVKQHKISSTNKGGKIDAK